MEASNAVSLSQAPPPFCPPNLDAPAQVHVHQFYKSVLEASAQGGEDLAYEQVSLLTKVAKGAGEEDADAAANHSIIKEHMGTSNYGD